MTHDPTRAIAAHTDHFLQRVQRPCDMSDLELMQHEQAYEARVDAEDAARDERERQRWRIDTGRERR